MRLHIKDDRTKDDIIALNREAFKGPERAPDGMIADIYRRGVVFVEGIGSLTGAALVTTDDKRFNEPYVWMIAVNERYRGLGVASQLLDEIELFARQVHAPGISLMVKGDNADAIRLYLKKGYRVTGFIPGYYVNDNGLKMRRVL